MSKLQLFNNVNSNYYSLLGHFPKNSEQGSSSTKNSEFYSSSGYSLGPDGNEQITVHFFFLKSFDYSGNFALLAYLASFLATILFLFTLVLVLLLRRRKKKRAANQIKEEDKNPVYGIYYFADGEHIDQSRSEAVDNNENYGSQESVF